VVVDVIRPDEQGYVTELHGHEAFWMGGRLMVVRLPGSETGERFAVFESTFVEGHGPPVVAWKREENIYYVSHGQFTFQVGSEERVLLPGDTLHVPKDTPHTYRVDRGPARFIQTVLPGWGWESYVRAIAVPTTVPTLPPDDLELVPMEVIRRISAACGLDQVGPRMAGATRHGDESSPH
jgi:quercetin dioxygenase-like cupin family protein